MRPEFIYFDLGNVVCFFDRPQQIRQVAEVASISAGQAEELLIGSTGLHWKYESGQLNDEEFHSEFCRAAGTQVDFVTFHRANSEIFALNTALLPLVGHLEDSQIPLGILSNTGPSHWRTVTDGRYNILPGAFRIHLLSFEAKSMKPEEKIFRLAIERAGVPAERILFIDDTPGHVEAALRAGLDGLVFAGADHLEQELIARGVRSNF